MRRCCADDWHAPEQWQRVGLSPPTCAPLTAEEKGAALGGCQLALDGGRGRLSRIFQSAIDNWAIVLETYRSSNDRGEVRTLQAHVNAVLASLDATFQTFQEALDDPGTFSPFLYFRF